MRKYLIFETEFFTIKQADGYRVPGYLIVESKGDQTQIAEFSPEQATDLLNCLSRSEALVQSLMEPERIYIMKFGEVNPRVHFHVFPRTARIAEAYGAEVDDKAPFNGAKLVDWIWANHGSLGFTDDDIRNFIDQARNSSKA